MLRIQTGALRLRPSAEFLLSAAKRSEIWNYRLLNVPGEGRLASASKEDFSLDSVQIATLRLRSGQAVCSRRPPRNDSLIEVEISSEM